MVTVLLLAAGIFAVLFFLRFRHVQKELTRQKNEQSIAVATVERRSIRTTVAGTGTLYAQDPEEILTPKGLRISEVLAEKGDLVSEGQVLATVDHHSVQNAIADTQKEIDEIDKKLLELEEAAQDEELKAPVSGTVTEIRVNTEEYAADVMARDGFLMILETEGDRRQMKISALSGYAKEIRVSEGSSVRQGDVLMILGGVRDESNRGQLLTDREDLSEVLETLLTLSRTDEIRAGKAGEIRDVYIKEGEVVTTAVKTDTAGSSITSLLGGDTSAAGSDLFTGGFVAYQGYRAEDTGTFRTGPEDTISGEDGAEAEAEEGFQYLTASADMEEGFVFLSAEMEEDEDFADLDFEEESAYDTVPSDFGEAEAFVTGNEEDGDLDAEEMEMIETTVIGEEEIPETEGFFDVEEAEELTEEEEYFEEYSEGEPDAYYGADALVGSGPLEGVYYERQPVEEGVEIVGDSGAEPQTGSIIPSGGTQPETVGSVTLPDGTTGRIPEYIQLPDGTVTQNPGYLQLPDGTFIQIPDTAALSEWLEEAGTLAEGVGSMIGGGAMPDDPVSLIPGTSAIPGNIGGMMESGSADAGGLFGNGGVGNLLGNGSVGGMMQSGSVSGKLDLGSALGGTDLSKLLSGNELASLIASGGNLSSLFGGGTDLAALLQGGAGLGNLAGSGVDLSSLVGGTNLSSLAGGTDLSSLAGGAGLASLAGGTAASRSAYAETAAFSIRYDPTMKVKIAVNELDILSIQKGQSAEVTLDAIAGETFEGTVTEIAESGSNSGGSTKYTVTILVERDRRMREDMTCTVSILISEADDIPVIPSEAIITEQGKNYVYTLKEEDGTLGGRQEIGTGISDGEYVEVTSGLELGQTVYFRKKTMNFFDMTMGMNGSFTQSENT